MVERKIGSGVWVPYTPGRDDAGDIAQCHRTAYKMARDVGGMPEFVGRVHAPDGRMQMNYRIVAGEPKGDLLLTEQYVKRHGKRPNRLVEWKPPVIFDKTQAEIDALFV